VIAAAMNVIDAMYMIAAVNVIAAAITAMLKL
jgi:hypothetical protein